MCIIFLIMFALFFFKCYLCGTKNIIKYANMKLYHYDEYGEVLVEESNRTKVANNHNTAFDVKKKKKYRDRKKDIFVGNGHMSFKERRKKTCAEKIKRTRRQEDCIDGSYPKHRVYCIDAKRMKIAFDTEKAAQRFIEFNGHKISDNVETLRVYKCPSCGCYHITSKEWCNYYDTHIDNMIMAYNIDVIKGSGRSYVQSAAAHIFASLPYSIKQFGNNQQMIDYINSNKVFDRFNIINNDNTRSAIISSIGNQMYRYQQK